MTAFEIAVAVANASEDKVMTLPLFTLIITLPTVVCIFQSSKADSKSSGRHLADLPSLGGRDLKQHQDNVKIALSLQLPLEQNQQVRFHCRFVVYSW
jgi:hypothetical protein